MGTLPAGVGTRWHTDADVRCVEFDTACSGSATAMCVGNVAVRCSTPGGNHLPRIFDCSTVGQTCMDGVCALPAGANECATAGGGRCDGNVRASCRPRGGGGNGEVREPCPAGTACIGGGTGASSPVCQPTLTACAAEGARCDGDTAVLCLRDRESNMMLEFRSDCAAAGRRCEPDARGIARCVPRATGCTIPAPNAASGSAATEQRSRCASRAPRRASTARPLAVARAPCSHLRGASDRPTRAARCRHDDYGSGARGLATARGEAVCQPRTDRHETEKVPAQGRRPKRQMRPTLPTAVMSPARFPATSSR